MAESRQMRCVCEDDSASCVALTARPIDSVRTADIASAFKALGDPHRVEIVHLLSATNGPVCVVDIERHLPLSQSTISYHLKTLVNTGLLGMDRQGRWSYYTVRHERLKELISALEQFTDSTTKVA
ncbi:MAG: metalloregulator ArsR/SmtB family transcription factor [Proteobacteria bacterium]|nr:metalloregulator ArsR/SmtB family transcription factor [Pseudomonadota bacterium]